MKKITVFYMYRTTPSTVGEFKSGHKVLDYEGLLDEKKVTELKSEVTKFLRSDKHESKFNIHVTGMLPL